MSDTKKPANWVADLGEDMKWLAGLDDARASRIDRALRLNGEGMTTSGTSTFRARSITRRIFASMDDAEDRDADAKLLARADGIASLARDVVAQMRAWFKSSDGRDPAYIAKHFAEVMLDAASEGIARKLGPFSEGSAVAGKTTWTVERCDDKAEGAVLVSLGDDPAPFALSVSSAASLAIALLTAAERTAPSWSATVNGGRCRAVAGHRCDGDIGHDGNHRSGDQTETWYELP